MSISNSNKQAIVQDFSSLQAPTTEPTEAEERTTLLDDPEEWSAFGRELPSTGTWESFVVLDGMHCAACALSIEDALKQVAGVLEVDVSAATRRARVVWNPAQVLPSQWMAAVKKAGYRCLPAMDALLREHA